MDFSEKLKQLRQNKKWTQDELAEKLLFREQQFLNGNREEDFLV